MKPNSFAHEFPVAKVQRLRRAAARAATFPDDGPEGWHKSPVDPCAVLAAFPSLRIRSGYTLRAYAFREGGNGNAFVYTMPTDAPLPEPDDCPRNGEHFLDPPVPPSALGNVMEAIDGDGTPLSYLSASIFAREIREFGARWHGCDWSTHTILGANPFTGPAAGMMTTDAGQWEWIEPAPESWLTTVVPAHPVEVRFYTHSAHEMERIVRHVDCFEEGSCVFETRASDIARGPGGFVF
jgi:hypothetical protein